MKTVRMLLGVAFLAEALIPCACVQAQRAPQKIIEVVVRSEVKIDEVGLIRASGLRPRHEATNAYLEAARRAILATGVPADVRPDDPAPGVRLFTEPVRGGVRLVIEVTKSAVVRRIVVENAGPVPAPEILRILLTKPGKPAIVREVRRDVAAIQDFYQHKGFVANVTAGIGISEGVLIIPISVIRISRIDFKISGHVAERELRDILTVKEGHYYNTASLRRDYTALWNHIERKGLTGDIQSSIYTTPPGFVTLILVVKAHPKDGPASKPTTQANAKKIVEIAVKGNKVLNHAFIEAATGLKVGDTATLGHLEEARRNLLRIGLFGDSKPDSPEDAISITTEPADGGVKVIITVEENDVIKGFSIVNSGPIPSIEIVRLLQVKVGGLLNLNHLRADVARIQDYYQKKGYISNVTSDIGIRNGILELPIEVAKLGPLRFEGNGPVPVSELLKVMTSKEGGYYNARMLEEDFRGIEALYRSKGYLATVDRGVDITPDDRIERARGTIKIRIENRQPAKTEPPKAKKPQRKSEPSRKGRP
jgi:outer membrane protein assembly factor BamA